MGNPCSGVSAERRILFWKPGTEQEEDGGALPSRRYAGKIEDGLEHSRVLVLCMSANAFGSDWAQSRRTFSQPSTLNHEPLCAPLNHRSADSFPCGSTTFPSNAPCRNSFTSTGNRKVTNECGLPLSSALTSLHERRFSPRNKGSCSKYGSQGVKPETQPENVGT